MTPSCPLRCLVALAVLATAIVLAPARPGHALEGAAISSETTYRLDPTTATVTVESTYRLTNQSPNRNLGGGRYEYYYFTGMALPFDAGATDPVVQVNGRDASYTVESDEEGYPYLAVEFGYELRYGNTATVTTDYSLTGAAPRTDESLTRVNPAYVSFPAHSWADDGAATIGIEVPANWTVDYVGGDLERVPLGDVTAYTAADFDTDEFFVWFTARNDDALVETELDVDAVDGGDFVIASWPGDDEWLDFAQAEITDGLPILVDLVGTSWPPTRAVTVTEASTSYLRGYAGFHDVHADEIEVGEDLDAHTMQHELSHAWFNGGRFTDRFLIEGFAEEIGARTVERMSGDLLEPATDAAIRVDWGPFTPFPLVGWYRNSEQTDAEETYGYAASFRVVRALRDEIGEDGLRDVLTVALAGERAYPDRNGTRLPRATSSWRQVLDIVEQETESTQWREVLIDLALDDDDVDALAERDETLARYDELQTRGDGWWPTIDARQDMSEWRFGAALLAIDAASAVLTERDELRAALEPIALREPSGMQDRYEGIRRVPQADELVQELDALVGDAEQLVTARTALTEVLDELGQQVPELGQAEYDADPTGTDEVTSALVEAAEELRVVAAELDALLEGSGLTVPPLAASAFADDPAGSIEATDERVAATSAVLDARHTNDEAASLLERVGRVGSGIDDDIADAESALADGRYADATAASADITDDVEALSDAGTRRLVLGGGAIALLLLLLAAVFVVLRRRHAADAEEPVHEPVPDDTLA